MEKDEIFETAQRYVNHTGRSVFLTGKAGTGKTTFLRYITQNTLKRYVVLAPTGVAAINAGGVTIHSFFQLPLCPYLPDVKELVTEYQTPDRYRSLRKERIKIIRTLDLLIIDEISMVRADLLDAVDMSLRKYRHNDLPFGGVQLLMIGDARQLSPVVKDNERQYMSQVYPSPYFFHSKALQKLDYVTIELQKVYRQRDDEFIGILNAIRDNRVTESVLRKLNSRVHAFDDDKDTIRLTTHNAQADSVNMRKLAELPGEVHEFDCDLEGDFPEHAFPADSTLALKVGAQVMFVRNDSQGQYYNGKIAWVESISRSGSVTVVDEAGESIYVAPSEWENIEYSLDKESGEIRPEVVGKFRQLPLRIAWAITIHKSQGLTFDKVIIDAGSAFAFGQVYVALSRCRTLEGISLDSQIGYRAICSDLDVAEFTSSFSDGSLACDRLPYEERAYFYSMLRDVFSMSDICRLALRYRRAWTGSLENVYVREYETMMRNVVLLDQLSKTADTFKQQISRIEASSMPDDSYLNERLHKASEYFRPKMEELLSFFQSCSELEIDNKDVKARCKETSDELLTLMEILCRSLEMIQTRGFSVEGYNAIRTECLLSDRRSRPSRKLKKLTVQDGQTSVVNDALRERLQEWRTERFKKDNVPAYTIMHQSTLMAIATLVPHTKAELLSIKGFGEASYKKYGEEILEITSSFSSLKP